MKVYVIRERTSGLYIGTGGSRAERTDTSPRLFPSHNSAQRFLSLWLKGRYVRVESVYFGVEDHFVYEPDPSRIPAYMEIMALELHIPVGKKS